MTRPRAKDYLLLPLHCRECKHLWSQRVGARTRTVLCPRCKSPKTEVQKPAKILDLYNPTHYNHHPSLEKRSLERKSVQPTGSLIAILDSISIDDLLVEEEIVVEETA